MKKFAVILIASIVLSACDSGLMDLLKGPLLSISDVGSIEISQIYINGGTNDDTAETQSKYAVYLRDYRSTSQTLIACAGSIDGMEKVNASGIYYANLHIPLQEVSTQHPEESIQFQIVFVELDGSSDCPAIYGEDDDIIGTSAVLDFDQLFSGLIWAENGRGAVMFKQTADEKSGSVPPMAASITKDIIIDKIYFKGDPDEKNNYLIYLNKIVNNEVACYEVMQSDQSKIIQYPEIIYSALGFAFTPPKDQGDCIVPNNADFDEQMITIKLMMETQSNYELVAEIDPVAIKNVIGQTINFKNDMGYISFVSFDGKAFSNPSGKVRLNELTSLEVNRLKHSANASINSTVELHFFTKSGDFSVACSGENQGLTNIKNLGDHTNLNASFVSLEGQKELFGWDDVVIKLIERKDGLNCPKALANSPEILANSDALSPTSLKEGKAIISKDGIVEFKVK